MGFLSGEISLLRSMVFKLFLFFSRFGFFGSDGVLEVKHRHFPALVEGMGQSPASLLMLHPEGLHGAR